MKANLLQQNTKKFLAGWLVIWLSSIVFLFCCEMPSAQAAEKESCPLAKSSHCNKKTSDADSRQSPSFKPENQALDCCIFPKAFDKARKTEQFPQTSAVAAIAKVSLPVFTQPAVEFSNPTIYKPLPMIRSGTYLKNCVFRI